MPQINLDAEIRKAAQRINKKLQSMEKQGISTVSKGYRDLTNAASIERHNPGSAGIMSKGTKTRVSESAKKLTEQEKIKRLAELQNIERSISVADVKKLVSDYGKSHGAKNFEEALKQYKANFLFEDLMEVFEHFMKSDELGVLLNDVETDYENMYVTFEEALTKIIDNASQQQLQLWHDQNPTAFKELMLQYAELNPGILSENTIKEEEIIKDAMKHFKIVENYDNPDMKNKTKRKKRNK